MSNEKPMDVEAEQSQETPPTSPNEVSVLYKASFQMSRATKPDEILRITTNSLKQYPYHSVLLIPERNVMLVMSVHEQGISRRGKTGSPQVMPEKLALLPAEVDKLFEAGDPYLVIDSIDDSDQTRAIPEILLSIPRLIDAKTIALIPSRRSGKLDCLIIIGKRQLGIFPQNTLLSVASLAELTATMLEKVLIAAQMDKSLTALQSLNAISQAVSSETDLADLYQVIHREVKNVIGEVNFAIATYNAQEDTIFVPYMFDGKDVRQVPSFPLGEGLTSLIIRSGQSLLMVDDAERRTRELGAKVVGKPAKSWLGVPLMVSGEPIGAIMLQDLEHEGRFDEDDQRLLETLAAQVAIAIRNIRLIENSQRQAARERQLYEITNKIRSAPDIASIMEITARELSLALNTRKAHIDLGIKED